MRTALVHPRYRFGRWVAAGGMGEVWQATDTLLDREVAVKVLRPELAQDPVLRARFAAEARHAGALQHPHVASVLDYGELTAQGGAPLPFLVMELVEGQSLSALLVGGRPLAPELAAELIAQAAEGIEAAHGIGIVHRDVKPGNLLLTAEGQVKVTDFGVARAAHTASLTMTGHLIGTPHYLSPEQAEGRSATAVSDVYSLGIVLYECLTGSKPFAAETPVATAVMQIREPLPPFPVPVPERLRRITEVATAKDPSARFRSAGAMAAALRDESPETLGYLMPASEAVPPAGLGHPPFVAAAARHRSPIGRRVLAGLATLVVVAAGVWATTASTDDPLGAPAAEASSEDVPDDIRIRARDYLGTDLAVATRELEELGLRPLVVAERRPNPGQHERGTVAAISPTGLVEPGAEVRLTAWAPPAPTVTSTDGDGADDAGDGTAAGRGTASGARNGGGSPGDGPGLEGNAQNNGNRTGNGTSNRTGNGAGNGAGSNNAGANGNGNGPGSSNAGGNGKSNGGGNSGGNGGGNAKPGKGGKR